MKGLMRHFRPFLPSSNQRPREHETPSRANKLSKVQWYRSHRVAEPGSYDRVSWTRLDVKVSFPSLLESLSVTYGELTKVYPRRISRCHMSFVAGVPTEVSLFTDLDVGTSLVRSHIPSHM